MKPSAVFIFLSAIGVGEAFYHAWLENAFSANYAAVSFAPLSSLFGIPYWVFCVVWFPLVLVTGLWLTKFGRVNLRKELLILLSVGNIATVYFWYLDADVVHAFNPVYLGLYVTNYALTGLVVKEHWSTSEMRDFAMGTVIGMVIGVIFGPLGIAGLGVLGGILGAISGYTSKR